MFCSQARFLSEVVCSVNGIYLAADIPPGMGQPLRAQTLHPLDQRPSKSKYQIFSTKAFDQWTIGENIDLKPFPMFCNDTFEVTFSVVLRIYQTHQKCSVFNTVYCIPYWQSTTSNDGSDENLKRLLAMNVTNWKLFSNRKLMLQSSHWWEGRCR